MACERVDHLHQGNVLPFARKPKGLPTPSDSVIDSLINAIRSEVKKRGGTWDEERSAEKVRRLADLMSDLIIAGQKR